MRGSRISPNKACCCCWISVHREAMSSSASLQRGVGMRRRVADRWSDSRRRWCSDTHSRGTLSAAKDCVPTQLSLWWPCSSPVVSTTSKRRPSVESVGLSMLKKKHVSSIADLVVFVVGCPRCKLDEINNNKTGIPYLNFFYIGIICLCSTLPIQSLFPYLYFMIRDLKVAKQEEDIGFYAGFVGASYFITRTISAVPWGIFADKYGRKPCIIISIISVIVFNTLFGLNMTYWMAIVTRALLGLLCGILGPIKAYASEVCRKEHQALGISLITSSWAIAFVVGPAIGGFLSQPAKKYPNVFSHESIFGRFPYFLPCLVISVLATGACVACIWLPETLHMRQGDNIVEIDAMELQVVNSILVGKPKISRSGRFASVKSCLKNWQLMSAIIVYCMFSLYDTAYNEIFSLWAVSNRKYQGLSFTSQDVGIVLAISGVGILIYQVMIYPFLVKHIGLSKPFRIAAVLSLSTLATYPFIANLYGYDYNCVQHSTDHHSDTRTKGCCKRYLTLMSIFKAAGPAAAGILFSWSQKNITGLFLPGDHILFLLLNMVALIGLALTFMPSFTMSTEMK